MKILLPSLLFFTAGASAGFADEKPTVKAELKAIIKEDAKAQPAPVKPGTVPPPAKLSKQEEPPPPAPAAKPATPAKPAEKAAPAVALPKVEVNKRRITELDRQLIEQDREIAREKKNAKAGEADTALNKTDFGLKIFGGETSKVRAGIAQERVELMEMERDLIETIARTKNKAEKAELQKQLNEIKAYRRALETQR